MPGTILLVVLILLLFGALPRWGYSRSWASAILDDHAMGIVAGHRMTLRA